MNTEWNLKTEGTTREVFLYQVGATGERQFVARFKHARPTTNANAFRQFVRDNFTPAEYFAAATAGTPPLIILQSRGYVSPNAAKAQAEAARMRAAQEA